jgi:hypothetical protein
VTVTSGRKSWSLGGNAAGRANLYELMPNGERRHVPGAFGVIDLENRMAEEYVRRGADYFWYDPNTGGPAAQTLHFANPIVVEMDAQFSRGVRL